MEARNAAKAIISISVKMIVFALIVILIYYAGGAAYRFGVNIFNEKPKDSPAYAKTVVVKIPDEPSVMDVAESLEKAGAVEDKYLFYVQAVLSNYRKKFVGGTFEVSSGMTSTEIMEVITYVEEESESSK